MSGMLGPAVLITLGFLFIIDNLSHRGFQWPVLLIVIGVVKILQYSASTEGHVPAGYIRPASPIVTPPPAPPAGNLPAASANNAQGYESREENRNG
jgi:hypothetical protein